MKKGAKVQKDRVFSVTNPVLLRLISVKNDVMTHAAACGSDMILFKT